jgi:Tat protein translocase TatB subunit
MFNIGPLELMVILVIALVVVGPKRLPEVGRTIGKSLREFRRATDEVKQSFDFNLEDDFEPDHQATARHVETLPDEDEFPARHVEPLPESDELPGERFDGFEEPGGATQVLDGHQVTPDPDTPTVEIPDAPAVEPSDVEPSTEGEQRVAPPTSGQPGAKPASEPE